MATGLDGIVFWGPIIIHNILDMDSSSGILAPSQLCKGTSKLAPHTEPVLISLDPAIRFTSRLLLQRSKVYLLPAGSAGAADAIEDVEETGLRTWATVQAALLSAIPFGLASICMLVSAIYKNNACSCFLKKQRSAFGCAAQPYRKTNCCRDTAYTLAHWLKRASLIAVQR